MSAFGTLLKAREASLFYSTPISRRYYNDESGKMYEFIYKLETVQPSGSFKDRGIGFMIQTLKNRKESEGRVISQLICSSGGNAGLSVATLGQSLGIQTHIVVPLTTPDSVVEKLQKKNAIVTRHGENWNAADQLARIMLSETVGSDYIPPFNDPLIWEGHSTIVTELYDQLKGVAPAAIVLSVGGGNNAV